MPEAETREAQFRRIMPEDEGLSGMEVDERRIYGEPWPAHSMASHEQTPFPSHLNAARWTEDHDEDLHDDAEKWDDE